MCAVRGCVCVFIHVVQCNRVVVCMQKRCVLYAVLAIYSQFADVKRSAFQCVRKRVTPSLLLSVFMVCGACQVTGEEGTVHQRWGAQGGQAVF